MPFSVKDKQASSAWGISDEWDKMDQQLIDSAQQKVAQTSCSL